MAEEKKPVKVKVKIRKGYNNLKRGQRGIAKKGAVDFRRKNFQRAQSKGKAELEPTVVHTSDKKTVLTPFKLPEDTMKKLKGFAKEDCYQCKGTGIGSWDKDGLAANICRCVEAELKRREEAYLKLQKELEAQLYMQATEQFNAVKDKEERPVRPCLKCQEEKDGKLVLIEAGVAKCSVHCDFTGTGRHDVGCVVPGDGNVCPACGGTLAIPLTDDEWIKYIIIQNRKKAQADVEAGMKVAGAKVLINPEGLSEAQIKGIVDALKERGTEVEIAKQEEGPVALKIEGVSSDAQVEEIKRIWHQQMELAKNVSPDALPIPNLPADEAPRIIPGSALTQADLLKSGLKR